MKKLKYSLIIILSIFSFSFINVFALDDTFTSTAETETSETESNEKVEGQTDKLTNFEGVSTNNGTTNCEGIIGNKNQKGSLAYVLNTIYSIMKIAGIVILIVLSMTDFTKAISSSDASQLNKSLKKLSKRMIILIAFFLVPSVLTLILRLVFGEGYFCTL